MVAKDFLLDPQVREWLDGVEPAWTLLTFESLRALRQEPSAAQTAIRIASDFSINEIAGSPVARNTLTLLQQAIKRSGLPLTATGNLSRAVVAEMCKLIDWPDYDQADAFRFNKVINEPDFLPLHIVRQPKSRTRPKTAGRGHSQCQRAQRRRSYALQLPHELNQIVLFLGSEFEFQDQVEELHRVFQCQEPAVMEIRWAVLDTPQRESLNRSISCFVF